MIRHKITQFRLFRLNSNIREEALLMTFSRWVGLRANTGTAAISTRRRSNRRASSEKKLENNQQEKKENPFEQRKTVSYEWKSTAGEMSQGWATGALNFSPYWFVGISHQDCRFPVFENRRSWSVEVHSELLLFFLSCLTLKHSIFLLFEDQTVFSYPFSLFNVTVSSGCVLILSLCCCLLSPFHIVLQMIFREIEIVMADFPLLVLNPILLENVITKVFLLFTNLS